MNVLLPEPLAPTSATNSPSAMAKFMRCSTVRIAYRFERFETWIFISTSYLRYARCHCKNLRSSILVMLSDILPRRA